MDKPMLLSGLLALSLFAAGCTASGDGSASVYVKDAPTDEFDEIHVVFTKVQVHAAGSEDEGETDDNETENDTKSAGWVTLFEDSAGVDVDLLNASGAQAAFLGEADLEAGRYTQLRVTVLEAYGVQNGTVVPFNLSSMTLKLNRPFEVSADMETRLVLDFDLDGSLHQQGNGAWRMTPVVGTVTAEEVEDDASGEDVSQTGEVETLETA